jgi:hypothetical protein
MRSLLPKKRNKGRSDNTSPFFIVGSVRSGTTMLRDFLRLHPRLECPEETHFFRWADPFGSFRFDMHYRGEKLFQRHREMDGIDHVEFDAAFGSVRSKRELADWYGSAFLRVKGNPNGRWFDKTPQNVYSVLLISEFYPEAKFIHIHRNPLNVVASLKQGKVMPVQPLRAAISAWLESAMILNQFRQFQPKKLFDVSYEAITAAPRPVLYEILEFVGEDPELVDYSQVQTYEARDNYKTTLTAEEIFQVKELTEPYLSLYGYGDTRLSAPGAKLRAMD